jgi:hypothetical protein
MWSDLPKCKPMRDKKYYHLQDTDEMIKLDYTCFFTALQHAPQTTIVMTKVRICVICTAQFVQVRGQFKSKVPYFTPDERITALCWQTNVQLVHIFTTR